MNPRNKPEDQDLPFEKIQRGDPGQGSQQTSRKKDVKGIGIRKVQMREKGANALCSRVMVRSFGSGPRMDSGKGSADAVGTLAQGWRVASVIGPARRRDAGGQRGGVDAGEDVMPVLSSSRQTPSRSTTAGGNRHAWRSRVRPLVVSSTCRAFVGWRGPQTSDHRRALHDV